MNLTRDSLVRFGQQPAKQGFSRARGKNRRFAAGNVRVDSLDEGSNLNCSHRRGFGATSMLCKSLLETVALMAANHHSPTECRKSKLGV